MTSRVVGIHARSWPTIIQHGNALRVSHVRLITTETSQAASTKAEQETLSWPRYLAIRKAKRRWELVSWSPFLVHTRQLSCMVELRAVFALKTAGILLPSRTVSPPYTRARIDRHDARYLVLFVSVLFSTNLLCLLFCCSSQATMLPSTAASFVGGLQYFGDHPPNFMGLDPLFMTIAATASCAGLGYLIGPLIGSSLWRLTHRRTMSLIEARDREFHHHVVRNRVDPTRQSATNPVPDFYGMSLLTFLVVQGRSLILL